MKIILILWLSISASLIYGQSEAKLAQSLMASAGGYGANDDYTVSWSIGEAFIVTGANNNIVITQGFGQPMICKTIPKINAHNTTICSQPYKLKVAPGFHHYRWKLDSSMIANENDSIYLPVTNGNYIAIVGDSTGCYIASPAFKTDFSTKKGITTITPISVNGRDTLLKAPLAISYQWYAVAPEDGRSLNIINADKQTFRPYYNGTYFVKLHLADYCVSYSPHYVVNNSGSEVLNRELYALNDTSIFFEYDRSGGYHLRLYPNPCSDQFNIEFESPKDNGITISILNLLGVEIEKRELVKSSQWLKIKYENRYWASGIYMVKIDDGHQIVVENLIVQ